MEVEDMTVTLVQPYNPDWPLQFRQIKAFVESCINSIEGTIEHVGSTSIPGMIAKPIIDIDIVVTPEDFVAVRKKLKILGYDHQGDLGIPKREVFNLEDGEAREKLPAHHLYVCETGAYELRKHLAFRDFMKQHPRWRDRLNRHKRELCLKYDNDRQSYIDGKSAMVQEITKLAMEWWDDATSIVQEPR
jgi:GrpB-like predicted nucleotidyltransferase (UPF0157 family)